MEKPVCPECDTELVEVDGKLPDKCAKCNFTLKGFPEFERWVAAIAKKGKKKGSSDSGSIFSALGEI